MNHQAMVVFAVLGISAAILAVDLLAVELVAIGSLLLLYFWGILTIPDILSGFSSPLVATLGGLFVVGGSLLSTGVAARSGQLLLRWGGDNEGRLRLAVMTVAAGLSAFMSSTGTVAILIPIVLNLCQKRKLSPSRLLIPMAYGCLIGGMLTLVGTAPNLVVQKALTDQGYPGFNFFSFTPIGSLILAVSLVYFGLLGNRLLPTTKTQDSAGDVVSPDELAADYSLKQSFYKLSIRPDSSLPGKTPRDLHLREGYNLNLIAVARQQFDSHYLPPDPLDAFVATQVLLVHGQENSVARFCQDFSLDRLTLQKDPIEIARRAGATEVLIVPRSPLLGQSLKTSHFHDRFAVNIIAIKRQGKLVENPASLLLKVGDSLLAVGDPRTLRRLQTNRRHFVVTGIQSDVSELPYRTNRAVMALILTAAMALFMGLNLQPSVIVVSVVAILALVSGCLTIEDAYRSVSWQSLLVVACYLPMSIALERTGGIDAIAESLTLHLGPWGPRAVMVGLFFVTALFSQFISNTATSIILAPAALQAASQMHVAPQAFLMTVAIAASAAFATPLASPVNMLVLNPGQYRFSDFLKSGLPLQLVILAVTAVFVPLFFPLRAR